MFKSAKVRRLEKEVEQLTVDNAILFEYAADCVRTSQKLANRNLKLRDEVLELQEARDAVAAGAKWLRGELDSVTNRLHRKQAVEDTLMNYIETLQNKIDEMQRVQDAEVEQRR